MEGERFGIRPWYGPFPFLNPHSLSLMGRTVSHKFWRNSYAVAERVIEWSPTINSSPAKGQSDTHHQNTGQACVTYTRSDGHVT